MYSENIVPDCNGVREDSSVTVKAIGYDYYDDSDARHNDRRVQVKIFPLSEHNVIYAIKLDKTGGYCYNL